MTRLDYLLWLLTADVHKLIQQYESIEDINDLDGMSTNGTGVGMTAEERESYRISHVPYLFRDQIIKILMFRVATEGLQHNEEARKTILEYKQLQARNITSNGDNNGNKNGAIITEKHHKQTKTGFLNKIFA